MKVVHDRMNRIRPPPERSEIVPCLLIGINLVVFFLLAFYVFL